MAETVKLLVDCDTGIDDALMLLYLAGSPEAEIVAVGSVHGNVPSPRAAVNSRYVLDLVGLSHVPVAVGANHPMAQPLLTSEHVHGRDGLGNINPPPPSTPLSDENAVDQMIRLGREQPGELTLLAVGPLTNLGAALLIEPKLPELIPRVVIMGGNVQLPGNITAVAEANIWHDPEAADLVFEAGWKVVMVGLDVTMKTLLAGRHLQRLEQDAQSSSSAAFACRILQHYLDFYQASLGMRASALHDPLAGAIALDPSLARYLEKPVRVELRGTETRGMTVADLRRGEHPDDTGRPDASLAMEVDSERFLDLFVQRVADAGR
ncbi:MAG TPA: nucleoside hydrolase [Chloroflexota bacterium]|nr:nucleoside hydrolase [Chloroflexota bacterium]